MSASSGAGGVFGASGGTLDRRGVGALVCTLLAAATGVGALAAFEFVYSYPSSWLAELIGGAAGQSRTDLGHRVALWLRYGVPALAMAGTVAALVRAVPHGTPAAALRFAAPALSLWAIAVLANRFGSSAWEGSLLAPRSFASAYLDHPWPPYVAGLAALMLGIGALRTRGWAGSPAMAGLALFVVAHAVRGGLDRQVAAALLHGVSDPSMLKVAAAAARAADAIALLALAVPLIVVWLRRKSAGAYGSPKLLAAFFAPLYATALLCTYDLPAVAFRDHLAAIERVRAALADAHVEPLTAQDAELRVPRSLAIVARDGTVLALDADRVRAQPRGAPLAALDDHDLILLVDRRATVETLSAVLARTSDRARVHIGFVVNAAWPESAVHAFPVIRAQTLALAPVRVYRANERIPARIIREGRTEPEPSVGIDLGKLAPATVLQEVSFEGDYVLASGGTQALQRMR